MFFPKTALLGLFYPDCYRRRQIETPVSSGDFPFVFSLSNLLFEATKADKHCRSLKASILFASNTQIHTQVFKTSASKMVMAHCGFLLTTTTFVQ